MKKGFLLILQFFLICILYAIDLSGMHFVDDVWMGYDENGHNQRGLQRITFSETTLRYLEKSQEGSFVKKEYLYSVEIIDGICFLNLLGDDGEALKWLMLYSDEILILYDSDDFPFFFGSNRDKHISLQLAAMFPGVGNSIKVSSELSEILKGSSITYSAKNMGLVQIPYPWVEGVEGDGIGEVIEYGTSVFNPRYPSAITFYLSNGYVSYNRPDLYKANGRIKKLRITQPLNNETRVFNILDTANLQKIFLDSDMDGDDLVIEILDVYPGEKYSDTCINYMFWYDNFD